MKKLISILLAFTMITGLFIAYANNDIILVNTDENVITEQQSANSDEASNLSDTENSIPDNDINSKNESEKESDNTQDENVNSDSESSDLTDSTEKADDAENGDNKENSENVENDENIADTDINDNTEKSENTENTEVVEKPENSDNTDNIEADSKTEINTEQTNKDDTSTNDDKKTDKTTVTDNNDIPKNYKPIGKISEAEAREFLKAAGESYSTRYLDSNMSILHYGRYIGEDGRLYAINKLRGEFRNKYYDYKIHTKASFKVKMPDNDLSSTDEVEIQIYQKQPIVNGKSLMSNFVLCIKGDLKQKWFSQYTLAVRPFEGAFYSSDGILGDEESIISAFEEIDYFDGTYTINDISDNAESESMTLYYNFNDSSKTVMNSITVSYDGCRVTVPIENVDYTGNFLGTFLYMMYPDEKIYTELCKKLGIMP